MTAYLQEARQLLRDNLGVVRHNQNGTRSIVVEAGGKRVIVTVTDGNASIATFGSN
jgi:predicted neutral ceramidase superfamily lipid hydrolase